MNIPHVAIHPCAVVIIIIIIIITIIIFFCANIVSAIEVGFLVVSLRLHLLIILRHSDQWAVLHARNATSREHSVAAQQLLVLMRIVLILLLMVMGITVSILGALIC